jgi:N-acetylglucosamine kinase-like BadF-type ATPase
MIVIADSGATKTDWRLVTDGKEVFPFVSKGLNPYFSREDDFVNALRDNFPKRLNSDLVSDVFFYGAGCAGQEKGVFARESLRRFFRNASIHAQSDMYGAAKSLLGDESGIVIILGTGSNIAYYNGEVVENLTPSLGFILGDEGSGAYIGRKLLRKYMYSQLPAEVADSLSKSYNLELSYVLDMIYGQPKPSGYLASFVPFVRDNISHPEIYALVYKAFEKVYTRHLSMFRDLGQERVGVTGSVGYLFRDIFDRMASDRGFSVSRYIQYPIEHLVEYHIRQMN